MSEIKAVVFDWAGTVIDFGSRARWASSWKPSRASASPSP